MFGINFQEHPSRRNIYVFHFSSEERAAYFEELLNQHQITFEKDTNVEDDQLIYYYGVHKQDYSATKHINYLVSAKFRSHFIADKGLRYFVLLLSGAILLLAIIGYFRS